MKTIVLDKIASCTARLQLPSSVCLTEDIIAREGYVLAARVLERNDAYGDLEDVHGRQRKMFPGDVIAGALGVRNALHGHAGVIPERIATGDRLHILNLGGVMGLCTTSHPQVGEALPVEVLGAVLAFGAEGSAGVQAHLGQKALPEVERLGVTPPVVMVSGTCMNAGKTRVAAELIRGLVARGLRVGAAKLTGVATQRDLLAMQDCGAHVGLSFCDAGFASTDARTAPVAARRVLGALTSEGVDVIVAELGDGLLGDYGVRAILEQEDIARRPIVHVCCASDPVGAFGAVSLFDQLLGHRPQLFSGPVTDNRVGCRILHDMFRIPGYNAVTHPEALSAAVLRELQPQGSATVLCA